MSPTVKLHVIYVASILVAVIIILATCNWGSIPELVSLMSFALTVSSLILGILAIVYAMYSNTSLSRTLGKFSTLTSSVVELKTISASLSKQVEAIPASIDGLTKSVQDSRASMQQAAEPKAASPASKNPSSEPQVESAIRRSSHMGLIGLYIASKAQSKKTGFVLDKVVAQLKWVDRNYIFGYLMACASAGIGEHRISHDVITVEKISDTAVAEIESTLRARIESLADMELKEKLSSAKNAIEQYFL